MVLQSVIFPDEVCGYSEIYYRLTGEAEQKEKGLLLYKGSILTTDTYMNFFDAAQWETYTQLKAWRVHLIVTGRIHAELIEWEQKYYLRITAAEDAMLHEINFESEEENAEGEHSGATGEKVTNENTGNPSCSYHLYLSPRTAIKEQLGTASEELLLSANG